MKPLSWNQIRAATLSTPAGSPQAAGPSGPARPADDPQQASVRNPGPLAGLRPKASSSSLGLRKSVSQLRLRADEAEHAQATTNAALFHAVRDEFPPAKVEALAKDKLIVDPARDTGKVSAQVVTTEQVRKIAAFLDAAGELEGMAGTDAPVRSLAGLQAHARQKLLNARMAPDKEERLTMVYRAVLQGIESPLKTALAEKVANMFALHFGSSTGDADTVFNGVVQAAIEGLRHDREALEGRYSRIWKQATRDGLAPFLDRRRKAELDALLQGDPERSAVEAWIGRTLSIQADGLIDSALKLATDNIVLHLTTEEMKSYYRRFTQEFLQPPEALRSGRSSGDHASGTLLPAMPTGTDMRTGDGGHAGPSTLRRKPSGFLESLRDRFAATEMPGGGAPEAAPTAVRPAPALTARPPRSPLTDEFVRAAAPSTGSSTPSSSDGFVVPDDTRYPEAAGWAQKLLNDQEISRYAKNPKETCAAAAQRIQRLLQSSQPRADIRVRAMLAWKSGTDDVPDNHFAVLAKFGNNWFAIDPTAHQFTGAQPGVMTDDQWKHMMKKVLGRQAVVYKDFENYSEASNKAGSLYRGDVQSLEGGTILCKPDWYARIREQPAAFEALRARMDRTQPGT